MPSLQVITLGCSKNTVDTEHLLFQVQDSYEIVPEGEERPVDVLLINTCGFIGDAKEQSIGVILAAAQRKKAGEVGRLLVCGCLSQRYADDLPGLIPEVDGWFGARDFAPVVEALGCKYRPLLEHKRVLTSGRRPYAFFKISEGCNRRCSYCAIPFIRGAHRSVPMEVLVKEAQELAAQGIRELVIIAQDTTYYGLDLYGKRCLAQLLRRLSEVEGIEWLRIHYSYPADFPEDVLEEMASNPKVCRYMDIPLQHVSDVVLDKMHRHVDGAWTRELIRRMREKVPGVALRTTLIVGHPGEGKAQFQELMDFVRESRFQRMGAFCYSEEEGTYGAEHFKDSIPERTKQKRLDALMELQRGISLAYNQSRIGTEEKVLVDDFVDGTFVCRSEFESPEVDGEILVKYTSSAFDGAQPESLIGKFLNVRITAADEYDLTAEVI
ncbi:MAG: 30S ribosomal protein S12 methylthiotransferase RimO [Bacteroidales bacterium]|nr:30S ribosomal protein S12 methylthiotransferase RimO [Bacteroidales bacterium]